MSAKKHDREIEYRREGLRDLIDRHGTDAVARVVELTPRTLLEYAGESARVIPLGKLEAAKRKLDDEGETKTNDG